ncbi:MAG: preprotein translocase subunit YajC [Alphaproteobacteria bacterium]|nr:MAG: preprotein translocase subunit YajC [Alphaproteobacteria bacterium]TAF14613.1 MAG: preprotein translocase subunit YajC [Alphaproteobacteria bacterium]TAF41700.1 MAG: preprotein translocase subunit YajC [Alphaproteobacteria bacterium]TAF75641.1 MAG: preprotein translocase subunit YajC [Alphaproteobacteria bacterium]
MFSSSAFAQEVGAVSAAASPSPIMQFAPLLAIAAFMYVLIIRPQQKRFKAHRAMVSAVKRGDKVLTSGGIIGKVMKVDDQDDVVHVEIADAVTIQVARSTLANVYGKDVSPQTQSATKMQSKKQKSANDN